MHSTYFKLEFQFQMHRKFQTEIIMETKSKIVRFKTNQVNLLKLPNGFHYYLLKAFSPYLILFHIPYSYAIWF